jgi:hypothetical protein
VYDPSHVADPVVNLRKRGHCLTEISELNPAEGYRYIRRPDQIDTGYLVVMSQQFRDTGPPGLSAATGYNDHSALKPSALAVANDFFAA